MAITKILNIMESEGRNPTTHLKNALEYIQNPDKTEECVLVGGMITIFMIIVNVQDHADQIQQNTADLQQITKGDILIHHTDHLPSVPMSSGSKNQKKT